MYRHSPYAALIEEKGGIGFATIKRNRFVALEASFDGGEIVTKLLQLKDTTLHLNAKSDFGEIIVEQLDANDQLLAQSASIQRDSVDIPVEWTGDAKRPHELVRLRIQLTNARIFALWCSH
jgi:hypothetical protein